MCVFVLYNRALSARLGFVVYVTLTLHSCPVVQERVCCGAARHGAADAGPCGARRCVRQRDAHRHWYGGSLKTL